ncbi:hypothetical protein [Prochlorococcus sp. MIT 1341]|uniref:hypothetical protein n=1 Tax=Prochlorococcus sp. MIT 1341 TaxID=3096221 RepID=UPI002A74E240|nr:hypothetical protein [Prochlorococcus sp. MIT 1341]
MSKEDKKNKKNKKNCGTKKGLMLAFGFTTLGARVISAVSLAAIALSFCSIKKESTVFNECVQEIRKSGQTPSAAVRFCNGG